MCVEWAAFTNLPDSQCSHSLEASSSPRGPSKEAFEKFWTSAEFRSAAEAAGLPWPSKIEGLPLQAVRARDGVSRPASRKHAHRLRSQHGQVRQRSRMSPEPNRLVGGLAPRRSLPNGWVLGPARQTRPRRRLRGVLRNDASRGEAGGLRRRFDELDIRLPRSVRNDRPAAQIT